MTTVSNESSDNLKLPVDIVTIDNAKLLSDISMTGNVQLSSDSTANNISSSSVLAAVDDSRLKNATNVISSPPSLLIGDKQMAEVDTTQLSSEHGDIRREAAEHRASIQLEDMKGFDRVNQDVLRSGWAGVDATKDARYDVGTRITNAADRVAGKVEDTKDTLLARSWDMGRDIIDNRTQLTALGYQIRDGFVTAAKDMEINALKTQTVVVADGDRTRALINDLKYNDLNRALVERNAELVEEREGRRYWRHHAEMHQNQGQWAQLQSQIQAFQSQLQETRQGMVNFGTMAGNAGQQTSTSNNVR